MGFVQEFLNKSCRYPPVVTKKLVLCRIYAGEFPTQHRPTGSVGWRPLSDMLCRIRGFVAPQGVIEGELPVCSGIPEHR